MSKSYQEFYETHNNKGYDVDGAYGWQCFDGYAEYCNYLGYPYANCTDSGYVKDIWNNRHSNGVLDKFVEVSDLQPGDVVVFKEVAGVTPWSHIAIFHEDVGGNVGRFFGQNQNSPNTHPDGGSAFNLAMFPLSAMYGGLRPKCFIKHEEESGPVKDDYYRVQIGAYKDKAEAQKVAHKVNTAGFDAFVKQYDKYFKVQVGAYKDNAQAEQMADRIRAAGFDCFIAY